MIDNIIYNLGEGDPPKFGDYEAQRHWMELTINLNVTEWYTNSTHNPVNYWPLDYPPVSGYYSFLLGSIFNQIIPDSVKLKESWGYESAIHKSCMRISVILSDVVFYHVPIYLLLHSLFISNKKKYSDYINYYISTFLFLCSPVLIIIDHGHFQYNSVMNGLFILAVYFLYKKYFIFAILSFAICINFKQMGLYYALPFPIYVLKYLLEDIRNYENKITGFAILVLSIVKYAVYTILFIILIWSPWIIYDNKYRDVLSRIFPIWRGIFEDKVATFWCTLNIIYKIKNISHHNLVIISFAITFVLSLSSCLALILYRKVSKKITNIVFFNVSMSFFLFSFHVHEKTILLPFLAYLLNFNKIPEILSSFSVISLFSLHPLLKRENQMIPYFSFLLFTWITTRWLMDCLLLKIKTNINKNFTEIKLNKLSKILEKLNFIVIILYHYMEFTSPPPDKYPWLYPTLNAAFSFMNFSFFFLFSNYKLINLMIENKRNDSKKLN